jgi:hypothetical protein
MRVLSVLSSLSNILTAELANALWLHGTNHCFVSRNSFIFHKACFGPVDMG